MKLAVRESEDATVHFAIVLTQQWRTHDLDGRILELDGTSGHRELAAHRMTALEDCSEWRYMRRLFSKFDLQTLGFVLAAKALITVQPLR